MPYDHPHSRIPQPLHPKKVAGFLELSTRISYSLPLTSMAKFPPPSKPEAPATKQDIYLLMIELGKLYDANERWKDDLLLANEKWKEEIIRHFDVTAENMRHDLLGMHHDSIELLKDAKVQHHQRISRIERFLRLPT